MNDLVFIAENNIVQQKLLKVHFEEMPGNYVVRVFNHPGTLLAHLNEKPFVVILDHFFGDEMSKTGLEYLRVIKIRFPSTAVIYYTSEEDEDLHDTVMALGAEQYIIKNNASLVRLRTTLDALHDETARRRAGFFQRFFTV